MEFKTMLGQLRWLAILEGISYLLFGITMPIKYIYDIKEPNYFVGMAHGLLFIAYCFYVVLNAKDKQWEFKTTGLLLLASLLPFATFIADFKFLKHAHQN